MVTVVPRIFLPALLLLTAFHLARGAVDTTAAKAAFQFLEESISPRQIGMGGAGTAMQGAGFCNYNPAQPYFTGDPSLSIGYLPMPGDAKGVFAEGFWSRPDLFFGMHLSNHAISDIIPSTVQGINENTLFSSGFSLISLAAGMKRERYCLAVALSGMQDRIGIATAYGVSVSAGAAYRAIPGKLDLGLGLLNEGTATGYTDETKKWGQGGRMPRSARLGASFTDTIRRVPFSAALDVVYRDVGDKLEEARGVVPRLTVPVGVEVWPTQYVALRLGKRFNFETEVVSFGGGFRFRPLSFDMSFVITKLYRDIEVKPGFGLTYSPAPKQPAKTVITAPAVEVKPLNPEPSPLPAEVPVDKKIEPQQQPAPTAEQPKTGTQPQEQSAPQAQPQQTPAPNAGEPPPSPTPVQPQVQEAVPTQGQHQPAPQPQPTPSPQDERKPPAKAEPKPEQTLPSGREQPKGDFSPAAPPTSPSSTGPVHPGMR
jgi:hypothetical protein